MNKLPKDEKNRVFKLPEDYKITNIDMQADFDRFIELAETSFGSGISKDKGMYHWYFCENPNNPDYPDGNMLYIMKHESEPQIIAVDGLQPFRFRAKGRTYYAAHSVESMTNPNYKGQGAFRKMTENSLKEAREAGMDFVLGLANKNSYPAYEKFGWTTLFEKRIRIRPIHIYPRLRRKLKIVLVAGIAAFLYYLKDSVQSWFSGRAVERAGLLSEVLDSVPREAEDCYMKYRDCYNCLIERDFKYLDYRYNKRPDARYKTIAVRRDVALEGFAIARRCSLGGERTMLAVTEFFCNPEDAMVLKALIRAVVEHGYAQGVEYMVLSVGGNRRLNAALARAGFTVNKKPLLNNMVIACRVSPDFDMSVLDGEEGWMLTQGDAEAELHLEDA